MQMQSVHLVDETFESYLMPSLQAVQPHLRKCFDNLVKLRRISGLGF